MLWGSPGPEEGAAVDDLLEWHPQLWITPDALPFAEARSVKPDGWITHDAPHSSGPLSWVEHTFRATSMPEVNLVLGLDYALEPLFEEFILCPLSLTLWCGGYRYFKAGPPARRIWVHARGSLAFWIDHQWQEQALDSDGFQSLNLDRATLVRYRPFPKLYSM